MAGVAIVRSLAAALGDTVWAYGIDALDETWVVAYELRWEGGS